MSQISITNRTLDSLKAAERPFFVRDRTLKGFGVKVNPTGTVKFVAEVWYKGRSNRKTLGEYPVLDLQQARINALSFISQVKSGQILTQSKQDKSLGVLFDEYISKGRLKTRTVTDYREAVCFYLQDWLDKPIISITKELVEKRFYKIRDKGINGGIPTFSQATKTMRILSALMNYAMADDLIESNPVNVLKQKRVDRSIRKRSHYLSALKVRKLLDKSVQDDHPATLAVHLMLYTGLRKNEALRLKWSDIKTIEGILCIVQGDTKNHRPHHVPVTTRIQKILTKARNNSEYLFQSTQRKGFHVINVRRPLKRLSGLIGVEFKCHDLRRTFATRAAEVGIDYLMIKRMLNHRSGDITSQYIQWNSRQNLQVMRDALERIKY